MSSVSKSRKAWECHAGKIQLRSCFTAAVPADLWLRDGACNGGASLPDAGSKGWQLSFFFCYFE